MKIRSYNSNDLDQTWDIFREVIQTGDTYAYHPNTSKEEFISCWLNESVWTYVAEVDGKILGTFILKPNDKVRVKDFCNASYMVHPKAQRQGIGQALCDHSFKEAKRLGYRAMVFNMVVSTNVKAISLWEKNGFSIVGRVPKGYQHQRLGLVDTLIMHKRL